MKIAFVSTWAQRCGIYTYSKDLAPAIAAQGHEVYIVRIPFHGYKSYELLFNSVVENTPRNVDLIHVQHEYGLYQGHEANLYPALKLLKKPIVTTMHAVGNITLDEHISRGSNRLITHNEYCHSKLEFPSTIIPHGCAIQTPADAVESKKKYGIPPEAPIIGYLGYISPYKGIDVLVEAVKRIPNIALMIAGGSHTAQDTEYMTQLKEKTLHDLQGRCVWTGYVPEQNLKYAYGAMDILVYPSRYTTESGALLTAMGYGRVILASNLPPFKEKEKLGALATYDNASQLEEAIKTLIHNKKQRTSIQEHAYAYCQENSWENIATKHIELYKGVLNEA
jgi:glycosyltransferase involved in cell wall biosynthesis